MAFIPVTNAAQVSLQFSQADGSFAENVFWVKRSIAWDVTSLTAMAAAFKTWWETGTGGHSYKSIQANDTSLVAVAIRDMTTQTSDSVVYNTGLPETGGSTDATPQLGLTFTLTARTGLAGRSQRGRTFLIGMPTTAWSAVEFNQISAAFAANAVTAFGALIPAVVAADADSLLVVCSRFHNNAPRATGITTPVASYGFHDLLSDFQRRRAPGHNRHH